MERNRGGTVGDGHSGAGKLQIGGREDDERPRSAPVGLLAFALEEKWGLDGKGGQGHFFDAFHGMIEPSSQNCLWD